MRALALASAAAAAAAASLPGHPLGIGVPIVALLVAIAVGASRALAFRAHPTVFGSIAMALAAMSAVRDAPWVVTADLVATVAFASIAAAGGTRGLELAAAAVSALARSVAVPAFVASAEIDGARIRRVAPVARGTVVGGLVVLPFGALFWSADGAFAHLGASLPLPSAQSLLARLLTFGVVLVLTGGLVLSAQRPLRLAGPDWRRELSTVEWAIPLALLDLLFLAFVLVQLTVLFGGNDHVLHTAGLTYAEYARQGFVQLLVAAGLTLVVIATATKSVGRRRRVLLRSLLGVLCVLTLVVLASALRRLELYEDAFGFTRLRLVAHAVGLWLGALFLLVLLAGLTRHARWLPRTAVALTGLSLVALSLANPDGIVASRNVDRWQKTGKLDVAYVRSLSADAVPALVRLPPALREDVLAPQRTRLAHAEPWSSANRARARARALLARRSWPSFKGKTSARAERVPIHPKPYLPLFSR